MRFLIQKVENAKVLVDNQVTGEIDCGFLVFVGVSQTDTREIADKYIRKMTNLRIFKDDNDKTNLSLKDVNGSVLIVSQFTLYADCRKGNRPSFVHAGDPGKAEELYDYIVEETRKVIPNVQTGVFGAHMKVELTNDGPFTIILDESIA